MEDVLPAAFRRDGLGAAGSAGRVPAACLFWDEPLFVISQNDIAAAGGPVAGSIPNTYTASGLTLAANTSYWLAFTDPGTGTGVANTQLNAPVTSGSGDFTLGDTYVTANGGPWSDEGQFFVPLAGIDGTTAVPEPSTLALAILGGSSLLFRRRK
jgi:hypothetical protein